MGVYEILLNNYSWPTPVLKQNKMIPDKPYLTSAGHD